MLPCPVLAPRIAKPTYYFPLATSDKRPGDIHSQEDCIMSDHVNHPTHYTSHPSDIEIIEMTRSMLTCEGNMFKYVSRADLKGDATDNLLKAKKYNEFADDVEIRSLQIANQFKLARFVAAEPNPLKATLFRLIGGQSYRPERRDAIDYLLDMLIRDAKAAKKFGLEGLITENLFLRAFP
jgi:hypothetical protein